MGLFGALFGSALVPAAVFQEVVRACLGRPGANELRRAPWATVTHVDPPPEPLLAEGWGRERQKRSPRYGAGDLDCFSLTIAEPSSLLFDRWWKPFKPKLRHLAEGPVRRLLQEAVK